MSMAYFSYTFVENQNRQNNGNEFSAINALQDFAVSMNFTTKSTELFGVHCIMDEFECYTGGLLKVVLTLSKQPTQDTSSSFWHSTG